MLIATLACALAPIPQEHVPELGHLAPPHELDLWVHNREAKGTRVIDGIEVGPLEPGEIEEWRGSVVIVHAMFSWDVKQNGLPMVRDVFKSNRHRRLKAVSMSGEAVSMDKLEARCEKYAIEHPMAVTKDVDGSPYFVPAGSGLGQVFVIDPTGGIAWKGDPVDDEKAFLKAVREALERYPARPLERDASKPLLPAQELYLEGHWAAARKEADKVRRKLQGKDPDTADEAEVLIELFDDQLAAIGGELNALQGPFTDGGRGAIRLMQAIDKGYPKSAIAKQADERLASIKNKLVVPAVLDNAKKWVALEGDRPVLFPERKDKKSDHYARELERLLKRVTEGSQLRRLGMAQLDRYRKHR